MYLLDSSALIELSRATKKAEKIIQIIGFHIATTTSICIHEFLVGYGQKDNVQLRRAIKNLDIINFDAKSAEFSAEIERDLAHRGQPVNSLDVLIAGVCLAKDLTILTSDKDFKRIKNLKVQMI